MIRVYNASKSGKIHNYAIKTVDAFPYTEHVEAIILMTRCGSGEKK